MRGQIDFLAHNGGDAVAVAVHDVLPGPATVGFLDSDDLQQMAATAAIPLGHKVALVALGEGDAVTEYGQPIGVTRAAVTPGEHVHIHNIRSARWQLTD